MVRKRRRVESSRFRKAEEELEAVNRESAQLRRVLVEIINGRQRFYCANANCGHFCSSEGAEKAPQQEDGLKAEEISFEEDENVEFEEDEEKVALEEFFTAEKDASDEDDENGSFAEVEFEEDVDNDAFEEEDVDNGALASNAEDVKENVDEKDASKDALEEFDIDEVTERAKDYDVVFVEGKKKFACKFENCDAKYSRISGFFLHRKAKHLIGRFICEICESQFRELEYLHMHFKNRHEGQSLKCPLCKKVCEFSNFEALREHFLKCIKNIRNETKRKQKKPKKTQEKRFFCDECEKSYRSKRTLEDHKNVHKGLKPFKCSYEGCEYRARTQQGIKQHFQRHLPKDMRKTFKCDQCEKSFTQHCILQKHISQVHEGQGPETAQCPQCGLVISNKINLKKHMTSVHGERNIKCPQCPKKFTSVWSLKVHSVIHTDPGHMCEQCGKAFRTKESLIIHERVHTGEEPFKCQHCPYTAKATRVLRKHMKAKHKDKI